MKTDNVQWSVCVMTVNLVSCAELHLERQCLEEQQQQLELRHCELTTTAELLTSRLQVLPMLIFSGLNFLCLVTEIYPQTV